MWFIVSLTPDPVFSSLKQTASFLSVIFQILGFFFSIFDSDVCLTYKKCLFIAHIKVVLEEVDCQSMQYELYFFVVVQELRVRDTGDYEKEMKCLTIG